MKPYIREKPSFELCLMRAKEYLRLINLYQRALHGLQVPLSVISISVLRNRVFEAAKELDFVVGGKP